MQLIRKVFIFIYFVQSKSDSYQQCNEGGENEYESEVSRERERERERTRKTTIMRIRRISSR